MANLRASDQVMRLYLDQHMYLMPHFVQSSPCLQDDIKAEIIKAADGIIFIAKFHFNTLSRKTSPKAVEDALSMLPPVQDACDQAYHRAMRRIELQLPERTALAKWALSWAVFARQPLTLPELQHALSISWCDTHLERGALPTAKKIESACAGLVVVDEPSQTIRLVHHTAQEHLERTRSGWFPGALNYIARVCINYLCSDVFEDGRCDTNREFAERLRTYPLFDYASRYWGHHFRQTDLPRDDLAVHRVMHFLASDGKVEASGQALFPSKLPLISSPGPFGYYASDLRLSSLHLAAYFGLHDVAGELLARGGVDVDVADSRGRTALSYAASNGCDEFIRVLLQHRARVHIGDNFHVTPLSYAAMAGRVNATKILLCEGRADAHQRDTNGSTPLSWAAKNGHGVVVELMLEHLRVAGQTLGRMGAGGLRQAYGGRAIEDSIQSALAEAASFGHGEIVKLLLDSAGATPLGLAAASRR
ncbi:Uncharacterized protein TPAR_03302 [Tolypocladium paradoxum]|uniref:GPI inositol-deacylase winged helix domain-containing protein n=1 Tax=Tolypocladium paradoxum TaxID=94208 RepID=A0A2S4L247_9HYPO|nr:Uncharacterized protein TPAR_03302 [Tolypocladium paradoxum]